MRGGSYNQVKMFCLTDSPLEKFRFLREKCTALPALLCSVCVRARAGFTFPVREGKSFVSAEFCSSETCMITSLLLISYLYIWRSLWWAQSQYVWQFR